MRKIISIILSFGLLFQQSGLVYAVGELNLANYLSQAHSAIAQPDQFRPPQLRYISYDIKSNDFKLLLDKGGAKLNELSNSLNFSTPKLNNATQELFNYFLIGLALPNDTFWVNLRPDAPENIIDPLLEKTDIGKIFLEADLQLKKDTASLTSPQNPEGKVYWDKLYKKAGELFGTENITIPTITRPWIVPNEVIVRETEDSAYIYKATLKVMLEADYLNGRGGSRTAPTPDQYAFSDPRLKELNEYSSQIIRETIIPKLTKEINSSKRYAQLRQVYYSLVLARWFKQKYSSLGSAGASANSYLSLIDSGNLVNLVSKEPCDKQTYFSQYQESFAKGEYNLKETATTPFGQSIRSYISGGLGMGFPYKTVNSPVMGIKVNSSPVTNILTEQQPPVTTGSPLTAEEEKLINEIITATSEGEFKGVSEEILYRIGTIIKEITDVEVEIRAEDLDKSIMDLRGLEKLDSLYWLEFIALLEKYSGVELLEDREDREDIEIKLGESVNKIVEDLRGRMSKENGGEFKGLLKLICRIEVDDLLKKVPMGAPKDKISEIKNSINKDKIGDAAFELGQIFLNGNPKDYNNADVCNLIWKAWRSVTSGSPLMTKVEFLSKINLIQEEVLKSFGKGNNEYYCEGEVNENDTYVIFKVSRRTKESFPAIKFRRIDGGNIIEISAHFLSSDLFYSYIIPAINTILPGIEYPLWQDVIRIKYDDYKNLTPEVISKFNQRDYAKVIDSAHNKILPVKTAMREGPKQEALTIKEMQAEIKDVLRAIIVTARTGEDFLQIDKLLTMLRVVKERNADFDVDSKQTHEEYPKLHILNNVFERLKEFVFKDGKSINYDIKAISVAEAIQEVFNKYCNATVSRVQNDSLLGEAQKDNLRNIEENKITADKAGELIKIIDWLLEEIREKEGDTPIYQNYKDNLLFIQEVTSPRAIALPLTEKQEKINDIMDSTRELFKAFGDDFKDRVFAKLPGSIADKVKSIIGEITMERTRDPDNSILNYVRIEYPNASKFFLELSDEEFRGLFQLICKTGIEYLLGKITIDASLEEINNDVKGGKIDDAVSKLKKAFQEEAPHRADMAYGCDLIEEIWKMAAGSPLEDYVRRVRVEVTNYHENRIRKGEPNYPYIDIGSVEYCSRDELKSIVLKITELENSEGRISSARAWREHYYKLSEITSSPLTNSDPVSVSPTGSPVTPREILELAKKEINETNREFQYYRVNHYISYYERIDTADPFSKEDVIKKLTNEITALQDVIDKSKQNGSQISDVVSFEALRTKNFFKDLRKKLKNSPNQSAETRNNEVEKSGSPLTPDESVNYVDEALKKLTNFYQWDNEKSSDATLDDLIEAAKKAGESKLKPNAMEVTSEVEEWYGLAEKLAKIKSEWSVYAGSPLTIEQSKELFKEIVKTIQERGPTSRYKKISSMQGREYATFSGLKKLCEEFISYFEAEPGLYSLKKGELGRLKKFSLSLNVSIIAEKFPEKFYQSIATKMALLNSDYLTDIEYDPNGRPSHARFRGAIKIDIEDGQGNVRPFSCDIKVFPDNKIENKYEVMLIQGSDRVSIIVSEHGNKPAPINTNLFYNFHSDEELIPVAQSIVSFFNYPRAVASPLEILTEKFKAKGFSYGSLNAYVKLKEYLKELDAGQPIELDGIVYDSKSIEIINTIDNANNRYAQISVFSEDKSVPYHRIIIRGYQKSGSVFTYLDMGQDYERQDNEKKLPKDREDLKERLEGTAFNDYDNFADVIMTAINKAVSKPTKKASGSLPAKGVSSSLQLKRGGIDLTDRMLKINLERVGSFASSALILPEITNLEALDLDKEFEQIQAMVSSSIRPSDTRILEFAAACYYREEFDQRLAQVSSCIKAAHLADEISGRDSSDALRLATMLPDALYGG